MKKIFLCLIMLFGVNLFAENVQYNILVTMDYRTTETIKDISEGFEKNGITSLYSEGYIPHITLYQTEYEEKAVEDLKKVVDLLGVKTKQFELDFHKISVTAGGWVFLDNHNTTQLQALADEAMFHASKYRALDAEVPGWAKSLPDKVKSFKDYGSPNVFANYTPHVTLLTPNDKEKVANFMKDYKLKNFQSKVVTISLAKSNPLGQTKEIIYSVDLIR